MITMIPYSKELRTRVVAAVEHGEWTIAESASVFSVGLTFVKKMLRLPRAGEDLAPRHGGGPQPLWQDTERALLRAAGAQQPAVTLAELHQGLAPPGSRPVSLPTLCRARQHRPLPHKKKVSAPRSGTTSNGGNFGSW
jgi:putative transposase